MSKVNKAKELVGKAHELRGNRAAFLRQFTGPIREQIKQIQYDQMLSAEGKSAKIKEVKEKETKNFMKQVALRKQAYQHYLGKARNLAKQTIEENFIKADDATLAKFNRDFSELKFKMALKNENGAFDELKSFVDKTPDPAYASLVLEHFHELAGQFSAGELKLGLSKTYDQLKSDFTPEEVAEAFNVIEAVDGSINNKMFTIMMPGDNPNANVEYGIISELFTQDALRYYQEPEKYYEKQEGEKMPEFVDPEEVAEQAAAQQKSKFQQEHDTLIAILEEKTKNGELKLGGNQ
nr:hypothetical protein [Neobacillus sp. Marseille-Q6967]